LFACIDAVFLRPGWFIPPKEPHADQAWKWLLALFSGVRVSAIQSDGGAFSAMRWMLSGSSQAACDALGVMLFSDGVLDLCRLDDVPIGF
jgi:hypothetical protein